MTIKKKQAPKQKEKTKITIKHPGESKPNVIYCDRYILSIFAEKEIGPLKFDDGDCVLVPFTYADKPEQALKDMLTACGRLSKEFDAMVALLEEHKDGNKDNG